jgi:hypothetical protein
VVNFVYSRSSRLHFSIFCLYSCIGNKEEMVVMEKCYWMHLEGFHVVLSQFWAPLDTGLTGQCAGLV